MGLPDVSYYFMEDSYGTDVQTAYKIFITRALQFLSNLTHIVHPPLTLLITTTIIMMMMIIIYMKNIILLTIEGGNEGGR